MGVGVGTKGSLGFLSTSGVCLPKLNSGQEGLSLASWAELYVG